MMIVLAMTVTVYTCRSLTRPALTRSSLPSMDLSSLRRKRDWSQDARCLVLLIISMITDHKVIISTEVLKIVRSQ